MQPEGNTELTKDFMKKSILKVCDTFFKYANMKQSLANMQFLSNIENASEFIKYAKLYILAYDKVLEQIGDVTFIL